MAKRKTCFLLILLLSLLHSQSVTLGALWPHSAAKSQNTGCFEIEREALLKFKDTLTDPFHCLSSWVGKNCCNWVGVRCSKQTGNVIRLQLRGTDICSKAKNKSATDVKWPFSGELNPSLLDLKFLNHLDLSQNDFTNVQIPSFLGSLGRLKYLNLSFSSFGGLVPPELGNLSNLQYLCLSTPSASVPLWASELSWLSGLTSLLYLDMSNVNLSRASNSWLQSVNKIPSLSFLRLSSCGLSNLHHSLPLVNFTSLSDLDLSYNHFDSGIPSWLSNITSLRVIKFDMAKLKGPITEVAWRNLYNLRTLDLSSNLVTGEVQKLVGALTRCTNNSLETLDLAFNELTGNLPSSLGSLDHLRSIRLQGNKLSGSIPSSIGNLSYLTYLDLSNNIMNGTISSNIGQLAELSILDLVKNSWVGTITEIHFQNLTRLSSFSVSSKMGSLIFSVTQNWVPSFNLVYIKIHNCHLGPVFPAWLRTQRNLLSIVLKNTGISDTIPNWFWDLSPQITTLDLSNNSLKGSLPNSLVFGNFSTVNLGFSHLEGSIPIWSGVNFLSLSSNFLSGSIPSDIGQMSLLEGLDLSGNLLNDSIPSSIRLLNDLSFLDLSNNRLSGKIPVYGEEYM